MMAGRIVEVECFFVERRVLTDSPCCGRTATIVWLYDNDS